MGELSTLPAVVSPVEQRALIGKFDEQTKADWAAIMRAFEGAGLLELSPDTMQADLFVRAYQRVMQLDEIEYETHQKLAGVSNNPAEQWYKEQVKLLNDYLVTGALRGAEYAEAMQGLTTALMARLSNTHNLLAVVSKARFQHLQFLTKGMHNAAFSRLARKVYGKSDGHDMDRLMRTLRDETDELDLAARGGRGAIVEERPGVEIVDAQFSEVDNVMMKQRLADIRLPAEEKE